MLNACGECEKKNLEKGRRGAEKTFVAKEEIETWRKLLFLSSPSGYNMGLLMNESWSDTGDSAARAWPDHLISQEDVSTALRAFLNLTTNETGERLRQS